MFALAAAIVAILAVFGIGHFQLMLWLFLALIALHWAFVDVPITQPWTRRNV